MVQVRDEYLFALIDILRGKYLDGRGTGSPIPHYCIGFAAVVQEGVEHVDALDTGAFPFFCPSVVSDSGLYSLKNPHVKLHILEYVDANSCQNIEKPHHVPLQGKMNRRVPCWARERVDRAATQWMCPALSPLPCNS